MTEVALAPRSAPVPALIVVAHGSRDPRAAATIEALAARVRASRTDVDVVVAYLDHAGPRLHEALATGYERGHREAVVVPLLLTAAYHSKVDLPRQLAAAVATPPCGPSAAPAGAGSHGLAVRQAPVLGPDPAVLTALERRIHRAGSVPGDPRWGLVVAAAGSADPDALGQVAAVAAALRRRGWGRVVAGFAASARPSVPDAVALLRYGGVARVAIASYLLTPGRFSEALRSAGADVVSDPLADTPEVAGLVLRRYDAEVRGERCRPAGGARPSHRSTSPSRPGR